MKKYWGVEVQLHTFLTSALDGDVWSDSYTGQFTHLYPLDSRLGGPQWLSGHSGKEKMSAPLSGIECQSSDL
jgi:hypothetical protein